MKMEGRKGGRGSAGAASGGGLEQRRDNHHVFGFLMGNVKLFLYFYLKIVI
jgi:hypothetical protein